MDARVQEIVSQYELLPHPEGGYYKETYRSIESIEGEGAFPAQRSYSTGIYFLLHDSIYSAFHRIQSDEMWHFYEGTALEVIEIDLNGKLIITELGKHGVYQYTVKAGHWFASRVMNGEGYALVGCTVSPGFDFQDFELADEKLIAEYPDHEGTIVDLLVR